MSEKRKFQLNIKFGGGYEAPLLNIEGDTPEEFQANVQFATASVEAIVEAATLFQATYNVKKPQEAPPAPAPAQTKSWSNSGSQQSQQADNTQPDGPPPSCRHGSMTWKPPGYSQRTKKNYAGFWTCPSTNRQDQCAAVNP